MLANAFVSLEALPMPLVSPSPPFHGEVRSEQLSEMRVATIAASPHLVRRTESSISEDGGGVEPFYQLSLQLRGRCVVLRDDDRTDEVGPSDLMVLDCSRPYDLVFEQNHKMLCFGFPQRLLPFAPERMAALTAVPLSGRDGIGALLAPFLTGLAAQVHAGTVRRPSDLAGNVLNLLETLLIERSEQIFGPSDAARPTPLLRIKIDIESRLSSAELTVDRIAAAHQLTPRMLNALFEGQGTTLADWISERRLERCRRDLRDPTLAGHSIDAIASRWGLTDPATFRAMFGAAFGLSPEDCRRQPASEPGSGR
jgi:AraC-like DNA-binding protein